MKRTKHSLSHYKLFSGDMGSLIPVTWFEALPGDTIQGATSALIRVTPLLAPLMHPVRVRFHWWFVPNRLLWEDWEDFITGGPDGLDASSPPYIDAGAGGFAAGGLLDYMGVPPSIPEVEVSALPVRAYNLIFNENYRDQDLVTPLTVPLASGADATSPVTVQKVAWAKDRLTAARPWTQKGADVTLPLGTSAPVVGNPAAAAPTAATSTDATIRDLNVLTGTNALQLGGGALGATGQLLWANSGLIADLQNATAVDVNTVRRAFALQRYEEARAMYGSRYTEYLRYLGVRSSDARLQRPEYLGGGKQTIAFSEILQNSPSVTGGTSDTTGVGDIKGHGLSATRTRRWRRFFEEHGIVMCLMSVQPTSMYGNSISRQWSRRTKEDYYQRELERIGQEEIYRREVYAQSDAAGGNTVFGYNDRYSDYRHLQSSIAAEFRTSALNYWHMARIFGAAPSLNADFITCDPTTRVYASTTKDPLWIMTSHNIQARRMVGNPGVGKIV